MRFFVGLGRTLIGEFAPCVSARDYLTERNPHVSASDEFHNFMVSITVEPMVAVVKNLGPPMETGMNWLFEQIFP